MSGLRRIIGIGTLTLAVLFLMVASPVYAAETAGPATGGTSTTTTSTGPYKAAAPSGTTTTTTAPAARASYFSGGGEFTAHERSMEESKIETMEAYRIKHWRANYVRALEQRKAEKAALKKRQLRRLYPVSALAGIQP